MTNVFVLHARAILLEQFKDKVNVDRILERVVTELEANAMLKQEAQNCYEQFENEDHDISQGIVTTRLNEMEIAQTRELFAALISRPKMEDRLLIKPPFKFIHDIVVETIRATGYLQDEFTADELDRDKANASKDAKVAFLTKLKSLLINSTGEDGEIAELDPLKVVAGREADRTNALLQRLAIAAAAANIGRPSKQSRQSGRSSKSKSRDSKEETGASKSKRDRDREVEREKRRLSKASAVSADLSPVPAKKRDAKERTAVKKDDATKKRSSGTKTKRSKKKIADEDEGLGSATPQMPRAEPNPVDESTPSQQRESSGGTSKGDDSGIAEGEADSERVARASMVTRRLSGRSEMMQLEENKTKPTDEETTLTAPPALSGSLPRPGTAAGRPQTSALRPGTAVSRLAPPRVKRTKIADLNEETVSSQPAAFDRAAILSDAVESTLSEGATIASSPQPAGTSEFLVDEEEEETSGLKPVDAVGLADIDESDGTHGTLVNRIVLNAREIEREAHGTDGLIGTGADQAERRRLQAEVERAQKALQSVAQSTQPLARTLELISEDFDVLLREIEASRRQRVDAERKLVDLHAKRGDSQAAAHAQLRQLDAELQNVRSQIAKTTASLIENEKRIQSLMAPIRLLISLVSC
ncbi:MIP-T3 domain-containing protein [Aphelenchoides besseyi]|nr:MIP-T3 domain-containing protein [Aphelenchoides besseyi]